MGEKRRVTGGWHLTMSSTRLSMRMSTFEKEAHSPREQLTASRCRVGGGRIGWREGAVREFGVDRYTLLYLKWITNKDLPDNTWNSPQCYGAAWMGGEFRGEWIHVYV